MSTFVFVHGAWNGAWCWYKVVSRLRNAGHTAIAPDLASLGRDRTPTLAVSLAGWADSVCAVVDAAAEPVILVGHSRGGIVISEVAERRPANVKLLVYLTAMLLRDGETVSEVYQRGDTSLILSSLEVAPDQSYTALKESVLKEALYHESPDEDAVLASLLVVPEATGPSVTPVHVTDQRFGRVPRVYIECLRDRGLPLALQRQMYANLPCQRVISMDTDHSPFCSAPDQLVQHLTSLAG